MPSGAIPYPFGECRICNDKATGVHYGVATCEGCKGFFKRSTTKFEKYKCFFGSQCVLTPQNRNRCKYCRYKRCLEKGMAIDAVKMGRIPKIDKERALEAVKVVDPNQPHPDDVGHLSSSDSGISDVACQALTEKLLPPPPIATEPMYKVTNFTPPSDSDSVDLPACNSGMPCSLASGSDTFTLQSSSGKRWHYSTDMINELLNQVMVSTNGKEEHHSILKKLMRVLSSQRRERENKGDKEAMPSSGMDSLSSSEFRRMYRRLVGSVTTSQGAGQQLEESTKGSTTTPTTSGHHHHVQPKSEQFDSGMDDKAAISHVGEIFMGSSSKSKASSSWKLGDAPEAADRKAHHNHTKVNYLKRQSSADTCEENPPSKLSTLEVLLRKGCLPPSKMEDIDRFLSDTLRHSGIQERNHLGELLDTDAASRSLLGSATSDMHMHAVSHDPSDSTVSVSGKSNSFLLPTGPNQNVHSPNSYPQSHGWHSSPYNQHHGEYHSPNVNSSPLSPVSDRQPLPSFYRPGTPPHVNNLASPPFMTSPTAPTYPGFSPTQTAYTHTGTSQVQSSHMVGKEDKLNAVIDGYPNRISTADPSSYPMAYNQGRPACNPAASYASPNLSDPTDFHAGTHTGFDSGKHNSMHPMLGHSPDGYPYSTGISTQYPCNTDYPAHTENTEHRLNAHLESPPHRQSYPSSPDHHISSHPHRARYHSDEDSLSGQASPPQPISQILYAHFGGSLEQLDPVLQLGEMMRKQSSSLTPPLCLTIESKSPSLIMPATGQSEEKDKALMERTLQRLTEVDKKYNGPVRDNKEFMQTCIAEGRIFPAVDKSRENILKIWDYLMKSVPVVNARIIGFSKDVPGFSKLDDDDRKIMMEKAYYDIWMICASSLLVDGVSYLQFPNKEVYSRDWMVHFLNGSFVDVMFEFAARLRTCRLTDLELAILCAVQLTSPEREGLKKLDEIRSLHSHYLDMLDYAMSKSHPTNHSRILIDVFKLLPQLSKINQLQQVIIANFAVDEPPGLRTHGTDNSGDKDKKSETVNDLQNKCRDELENREANPRAASVDNSKELRAIPADQGVQA